MRDGQTSSHRPRLVVSRSTCPPFPPSPLANSFVIGTAVINTHSQVCGELMSNISATRGRPDMRFCVCGSPRGDLSHIAGLTLGCSRSDFFRSQSESSRPYMCGGVGLTQQIAKRKPSVKSVATSPASDGRSIRRRRGRDVIHHPEVHIIVQMLRTDASAVNAVSP